MVGLFDSSHKPEIKPVLGGMEARGHPTGPNGVPMRAHGSPMDGQGSIRVKTDLHKLPIRRHRAAATIIIKLTVNSGRGGRAQAKDHRCGQSPPGLTSRELLLVERSTSCA